MREEAIEVTSRLGTFPGVRVGRTARYEYETTPLAAIGLRRVQRFLDTHLRGELTPELRTGWADFPPAVLDPLRR